MQDAPSEDPKDKKIKTEDLLRMSIDTVHSLLDNTKAEAELTPEEARARLISEIKANVSFCKKSAATKEVRFILRALRKNSSIRRTISANILVEVIETFFPDSNEQKQSLLNFVANANKNAMEEEAQQIEKPETPEQSIIPEVEVYISLLVLIFLVDKRPCLDLARDLSNELVCRLKSESMSARNLDPLRAKVFFYYSKSYEMSNRLDEIRAELLSSYRTATLRHDNITQATLLNLLLRNYLEYNLYDQADKLVSKIKESKEIEASSNQFARYLYYTGRIKAIQLDYTDAASCLSQALRKAPQYSALGFRRTVQRLLIIVELLMGEIPQRSVFRQAGMKNALEPYFNLTMAVRVGDLNLFQETVKKNREVFLAERNFTLIQRLRLTVIKTGLRKINDSYSRIALKDICEKLQLDSVENTEFIVAKAIRDRVIDATINHDAGYLQSKETADIYSTQEPLEAFHKRISFCLNTHNEAVMAMRFPADLQKPQETEEERKERLKFEQELEELVEEEDEEDF